jgi:hypothetical protein
MGLRRMGMTFNPSFVPVNGRIGSIHIADNPETMSFLDRRAFMGTNPPIIV